ncbi:hypothetical protein ASG67_03690 [Sphingomonas sp. Leaf339]|nr:hypothetical protein ASG67_03690 [Sphingomonas sp. Leaf339]
MAASTAVLLAGCASKGEIDATGGVSAVRSACPVVGVPAGTGDVTVFDPPTSQAQSAIDLVATMTNVRGTCADATDDIVTTVSFDVQARRLRTDGARDVQLPYYIAVVRGGANPVAKRVGTIQLHFDAGQARAQASGTASATVSRSAATLPAEVRERLTRRRKAGDDDAAVDPLTQPEVRKAVLSASFEALVGFQLNEAQLRYNVTR